MRDYGDVGVRFEWNGCTRALGASALVVALLFLSGCMETDTNIAAESVGGVSLATFFRSGATPHVSSGSAIRVRLLQPLSSESANPGDTWQGEVLAPVIVDGREEIPAGSFVEGVVSSAEPAATRGRARLRLALRSVQVDGHHATLFAHATPMVSHSPDDVMLTDGAHLTFIVSQEVALR